MYLKNTKLLCLSALLWAGCANLAQAEIYKSVDADGHVTYSSTPSKGARRLGLEPRTPSSHSTHSSRSSRSSSSSRSSRKRDQSSHRNFPRVDSATQKRRDDMRYRILNDELASEKKLLAEAQSNLDKSKVSMATPKDKLKALQEEVTLHVKNISALKTELAGLK